jgi:hypothetical protein
VELLGAHRVALALIDHPYMHRPPEMPSGLDVVRSDFSYFRWLGDRHALEEVTSRWDKVVVDRSSDLQD